MNDRGIDDELADKLNALKRLAADSAVAQVVQDMVVGLGTGSTAEFVLQALALRIREGLRITGVPTSERTAARARELGIPLALDVATDIAIDGADEVDPRLNLIKGRGGALLREKIVARSSSRFIVVVDDSKLVARLGVGVLPIEVVQFGWQATARRILELGGKPQRRDLVTDNGNYILDCAFGLIESPESLASELDRITGVIEHGLFIGLAAEVHVGQRSTGLQPVVLKLPQ
jgi:ribose 5-phosphate isomerase A